VGGLEEKNQKKEVTSSQVWILFGVSCKGKEKKQKVRRHYPGKGGSAVFLVHWKDGGPWMGRGTGGKQVPL